MNVKTAIIEPVRAAMKAATQQASISVVKTSKVSCKPGCSACCKRYVAISLAEAMVMVDFLKKNGKWDRVAKAAEEQREMAAKVKPLAWFKMGIPCPVLNQAICDAYPVRPTTCSAHFVKSPPEACSPNSTSVSFYEPYESSEAHMTFAKQFETAVGKDSFLRTKAPMPIALLIAEKLSMDPGPDFDNMVASIAKEFVA